MPHVCQEIWIILWKISFKALNLPCAPYRDFTDAWNYEKRQKQILHQIFHFDLRAAAGEKGPRANLTRNYCNEFGNSILSFAFCSRIFISDLSGKFRRMRFGSVADWELEARANKMCFPLIIQELSTNDNNNTRALN